jgi:hypothetical protein
LRACASSLSANELLAVGVPSLDAVFALLSDLGVRATVEIKACSRAAIPGIARATCAGGHTLSSFAFKWLRQALDNQPHVRVQTTVERLTSLRPLYFPWEVHAGQLMEVAPNIDCLTPAGMTRARGLGLQVIAYTVKTAQQMEKALLLGVDGVFVNDPLAARRWLGGSS